MFVNRQHHVNSDFWYPIYGREQFIGSGAGGTSAGTIFARLPAGDEVKGV